MKFSFIMFFVIAFSVYTIGNVYLFVRGWQSLEIIERQRVWFAAIFWIVALLFIVSQVLFRSVSGKLSEVLFIIGSLWIAVMLYGFLMLLVIDILRIIGLASNIKPDFIYRNYPLTKAVIFGTVCLVISAILAVGYGNAHRPRATGIKIAIDKQAGQIASPQLRVVMVSDIHLGRIAGRKSLARIVDAINEHNPDIVMLAGDVFDGAPEPVIEDDMGIEFARLKTKYGVYMVCGNHEYIGERSNSNAKRIIFDYLDSRGVKLLLDTVVLIDGSFYVAGRKDRMGGARKSITNLLQGIDSRLPIIILDHQPYNLEEAERAGVDLQLSGHTHHGQMWPLNHITRKIYEQDWGFLQKGKSNFYISCGAGTWGPPVRTAGYSEIVVIDMVFNQIKSY